MAHDLGAADNSPNFALLDESDPDGTAGSVSQRQTGPALILKTTSERREDRRSKLFLAAVMDHEGMATPIRIRNLSPGGALIEGHGIPRANAAVLLRRGSQVVPGRVAWSEGSRGGLQFDEALAVTEWLPKANQQHQEVTDRRFAQAQSEATIPAVRAAPAPSDSEMNKRISEEVQLVARTLASIGEDLSSDPILVGRHGVTLQNLDATAQALIHLARVIAAEDRADEIGAITMSALRRRLLRRSL